MIITRETLVDDAYKSCKEAPELFQDHGVDVGGICTGMSDQITLADAEEWCQIKNLDGLMEKLNQLLACSV